MVVDKIVSKKPKILPSCLLDMMSDRLIPVKTSTDNVAQAIFPLNIRKVFIPDIRIVFVISRNLPAFHFVNCCDECQGNVAGDMLAQNSFFKVYHPRFRRLDVSSRCKLLLGECILPAPCWASFLCLLPYVYL